MGTFTSDDADQPGAASQPEDLAGDGPVTIEDRTEPGGQGSPGTNQAKTEPMSPTTEHPEPMAAPDLDSMNVGSADPQAPRHPGALGSGLSATGSYASALAGTPPTGLSGPGSPVEAQRPTVDDASSTGRAPGPEVPGQETSGTSHRAPGLQGTMPEGESVETDVEAGAARTGPQPLDSTPGRSPGQGDDQGVPSAGTSPSPGTSEEHRIVNGVRLPEGDGA